MSQFSGQREIHKRDQKQQTQRLSKYLEDLLNQKKPQFINDSQEVLQTVANMVKVAGYLTEKAGLLISHMSLFCLPIKLL